MAANAAREYGAQGMTAPLRDVVVKRPGPAFGAAFADPAHGFLHPVDLALARTEHDRFVEVLGSLGPNVHELGVETDDPDLIYTFDPLLVADTGAIPLRPGKPSRSGEPAILEAWTSAGGIPRVGRIEAPARSRVATPSGSDQTCCASVARSGPTRRASASCPGSSAATSGCSTCRTGGEAGS